MDEASDHALGLAWTGDRADIADVAASVRREQRQPHERRETRSAVRIGKPGNLLGAPSTDRAPEHALHVIRDILEVGAAAGQHDLTPDLKNVADYMQGVLGRAVRSRSPKQITGLPDAHSGPGFDVGGWRCSRRTDAATSAISARSPVHASPRA